MSTFKVTKVEFEPKLAGQPVGQFAGWVCIGYSEEAEEWFAGCDTDSPNDAYADATDYKQRDLHPATVQMFRVDPA